MVFPWKSSTHGGVLLSFASLLEAIIVSLADGWATRYDDDNYQGTPARTQNEERNGNGTGTERNAHTRNACATSAAFAASICISSCWQQAQGLVIKQKRAQSLVLPNARVARRRCTQSLVSPQHVLQGALGGFEPSTSIIFSNS